MTSAKHIIMILLIILILFVFPHIVNAADVQNATTKMNDVTVQWTYTLNEVGQVENLKCTNPTELKGDITVPSELQGKTVVSIGNEAFKSANNVTGVTISNSIKSIGYDAFANCEKLSKVDLGVVTDLSFDIFKGCTSLTTLKIPKTLKKGSASPCFNNPNITSITFEDGLTTIPSYLCANTGITTVILPNSVSSIGYDAFANCEKLSKVDLGVVTDLSFDIFKGCTSLTTLKIPKTLKKGSASPCFNNPNITSITFEDGLTTIPSYLCANTGITTVILPNSVSSIDYDAFANCEKLSKVDLGSLKSISFNSFKNCPKLKEIKIPKTLVDGSSVNTGIFTGTTVLTSVTFEEGLLEIPAGILQGCYGITSVHIPESVTKINCYAFAGTSIVEIDIPKTVKNIDYYAFKDCSQLKKATILDNCTHIGWFSLYPTEDTVFNNHIDELTIYCYEGSKIAEYAIGTKIKYTYLSKPSTENSKEDIDKSNGEKTQDNGSLNNNDTTNGGNNGRDSNESDKTVATGKLPQTGVSMIVESSIIITLIILALIYKKNKKYKDIK